MISYCKFGNFSDGFIFAKFHGCEGLVKIKTLRNGKITLSLTDVGKSCPSREFLRWQICYLMQFAKIKLSWKVLNLQYVSKIAISSTL